VPYQPFRQAGIRTPGKGIGSVPSRMTKRVDIAQWRKKLTRYKEKDWVTSPAFSHTGSHQQLAGIRLIPIRRAGGEEGFPWKTAAEED
jgi:hypothetical protein